MRLVGLVCVTAGVALLLLLLPHSDRIERSHTIPGPLANDSEDSAPQDRSSNPAAAAAARRRRAAELDEAAQTTQAQFCARLAESMAYLPSGAKEVQVQGVASDNWDMLVHEFNAYDAASNSIQQEGSWEMQRGQDFVNVMEVARAERQLSRSEAVFVDVGAGIGWFSMLLAANGYSVMAFEQSEGNLALLRRTLCMNPEIGSRVTLHTEPLASEERDDCTLYSNDRDPGDAHITCHPQPEQEIPEGYSVLHRNASSVTLGMYLEGRRDVMLLKLGVGGHEGQVVRGGVQALTSGVIPYITMESGLDTSDWIGGGMTVPEMLYAFAGPEGNYSVRGRTSFQDRPIFREAIAGFAASNVGVFNIYLTSQPPQHLMDQRVLQLANQTEPQSVAAQ